jgi:hypothetical protein
VNDVRHPEWWLRLAAAGVRRLPFGRIRSANWIAEVRRRYARRSSEVVWTRLTAPRGHAWLTCDLRDAMSREIFFNGVFEPVEVTILQNVLRPEMRFVDVGANRGFFSILASVAVGPRGRVLALEPDPRLYDVLVQPSPGATCRR